MIRCLERDIIIPQYIPRHYIHNHHIPEYIKMGVMFVLIMIIWNIGSTRLDISSIHSHILLFHWSNFRSQQRKAGIFCLLGVKCNVIREPRLLKVVNFWNVGRPPKGGYVENTGFGYINPPYPFARLAVRRT